MIFYTKRMELGWGEMLDLSSTDSLLYRFDLAIM